MLVITSQKKWTVLLGTWVVQMLVRKEGSPSRKWTEVLFKVQRALFPFMSAGWILWLKVPKDHERVEYHSFGSEAPKSFVFWLKMPV